MPIPGEAGIAQDIGLSDTDPPWQSRLAIEAWA
jgi:hypothetical protein